MMPSPDTGTDCVAGSALSVTTIFAVTTPAAAGVKLTPKLQVPDAATCVPLQLSLLTVKSPFDEATLITLKGTRFGLVKTTVFVALGTCTAWRPKLRRVGLKVGFTRMPVPERFKVCGLLEAASVIVSVPVRVPVWLGVKTTLTTQFPLGARLAPLHPSLETEKSPAEAMTLSICSEELFGLVSVTFLGAEVVSTSWLGNKSETGLMVNLAAAYAVAVPRPRIRVTVVIAIVTNRAERKSTEAWFNRFSDRFMVFPSEVCDSGCFSSPLR